MIGFALIEGLGGERVGEGRVAAATSAGLPVGAGERCIIGADAIAVGVGGCTPSRCTRRTGRRSSSNLRRQGERSSQIGGMGWFTGRQVRD